MSAWRRRGASISVQVYASVLDGISHSQFQCVLNGISINPKVIV